MAPKEKAQSLVEQFMYLVRAHSPIIIEGNQRSQSIGETVIKMIQTIREVKHLKNGWPAAHILNILQEQYISYATFKTKIMKKSQSKLHAVVCPKQKKVKIMVGNKVVKTYNFKMDIPLKKVTRSIFVHDYSV